VEGTGLLLSRSEIENVRLLFSVNNDLSRALHDCQQRAVTQPVPGFWHSKTGFTIIIGGVAVSVTGAFVLGGVTYSKIASTKL
jgi:hypothetical protein